jgi:hypothetical protein
MPILDAAALRVGSVSVDAVYLGADLVSEAANGPTLPVFEGIETGNLDSAETGTIAVPVGTSSGDVLLFFGSSDGQPGIDDISGFTSLFGGVVSNTGHSMLAAYRICDGTEPSSYDIVMRFSSERVAMCMMRFSGVDVMNPVNASDYYASPDAPSAAVFPISMTTTTDNCLVVACLALESGNSGNPVWGAQPSGWTNVYDNENGPPGGGNGSASGAASIFSQSSAGAVPSESVSFGGGDTYYIAAYIALAGG